MTYSIKNNAVNWNDKRIAGADSNVAIGLSRLGFNVAWLSRVGNDSLGRFVVETLIKDGDYPLGTALPVGNVKLLAPIPRPRKNIFGIGLNYTEHVAESARALDTST